MKKNRPYPDKSITKKAIFVYQTLRIDIEDFCEAIGCSVKTYYTRKKLHNWRTHEALNIERMFVSANKVNNIIVE